MAIKVVFLRFFGYSLAFLYVKLDGGTGGFLFTFSNCFFGWCSGRGGFVTLGTTISSLSFYFFFDLSEEDDDEDDDDRFELELLLLELECLPILI